MYEHECKILVSESKCEHKWFKYNTKRLKSATKTKYLYENLFNINEERISQRASSYSLGNGLRLTKLNMRLTIWYKIQNIERKKGSQQLSIHYTYICQEHESERSTNNELQWITEWLVIPFDTIVIYPCWSCVMPDVSGYIFYYKYMYFV